MISSLVKVCLQMTLQQLKRTSSQIYLQEQTTIHYL
nr:MAG TPA: hypothetical protein [Bacteriophage sp.]